MATLKTFWLKRLIRSGNPLRDPPTPKTTILGSEQSGRANLRLLAIADAAGATLQINLIRPMRAALESGIIRIELFTEDDEKAARTVKMPPQQIVSDLWKRSQPHLVFVSRYGGGLAKLITEEAARTGTPLIYHLDDNLFEVPNGAGIEKAKKYGDPARQNGMRILLSRSDVAYISTHRLARQLNDLGISATNMFVGEIASASDLLECRETTPENFTIGYMASSSHAADLKLALPGIIRALSLIPSLNFSVFGSLKPPGALSQFGERVTHVNAVGDYDSFLKRLKESGWAWGLAPLCASRFNEAKTNTKWVEYTSARIPTIVSRHPVYEENFSKNAAVGFSDADWHEKLPGIIKNQELARKTLATAQDQLLHCYSQARMTSQVQAVFRRAGAPEALITPLKGSK